VIGAQEVARIDRLDLAKRRAAIEGTGSPA
jgi:hypothetical protein